MPHLSTAPTFHQCQVNLDRFLLLCAYLAIPIAPEKMVGEENVLVFAGIELDTLCTKARLPLDKTEKCKTLMSAFLKRKKVTLWEIQSLIGLLNFACSVVVVPGQAFLCHLIDLMRGVKSSHYFIHLNKSSKADLVLWQSFFDYFNDCSFFLNDAWHD